MKAITCPQCGGLIRHILPRQLIAECEYCGAKIAAGERFQMSEPFDDEAAKFRALELPVQPKTSTQPIFIGISLIAAFAFVLFVAALIPTKSTPAAPPIEPEPFKPIIFPQHTPTVEKRNDDDAAIIFDDQGIGHIIVPKRVKRLR